jgi:hypothetical protein
MADYTLTVYEARYTGANFTDNKQAVTNADTVYVPNDGDVQIVAAASGGATITIVTPNTVDSNAITDLTLTAGTAKTKVFGPFPPHIYNDAQGRLRITVSANTDLLAFR